MPLLWSSLLLPLLIQITLLPNGYNAAGGFLGKQSIWNLLGNFIDNQPLSKNIEQIIEEVRDIYKAINKHEDVEAIEKMGNMDKSTEEAIKIFKQMAEQNVKDESSMQELIEIFDQMSIDWKKENMDGELFKDALIAKIAFNRFMQIFLGERDQEIAHKKSMESPKSLVKIGSFHKRKSFKDNSVHNILAIFALAEEKEYRKLMDSTNDFVILTDIRVKSLQKDVENTIEIVKNAIKFYFKIEKEQKLQRPEIGLPHAIKLAHHGSSSNSNVVHSYGAGKAKDENRSYFINDIRERLINVMEKQKEYMNTFKTWLEKMQNEIVVPGKNDNILVELIVHKIFDALVNKNESPFANLHIAIKKDEIFVKYAMKFINTENEEKAKSAIKEITEIFEQMPDNKWRLNRVLLRESSSLLEDAVIAKIVYNLFNELSHKHINADHQNIMENSENVLDILNLATKSADEMQLLKDKVHSTILAVDGAIKFFEFDENPYNIFKIKKTEEMEVKNEELKNKMDQQVKRMVAFKTWLDKVENIVISGTESNKTEHEMAQKILKSLHESGEEGASSHSKPRPIPKKDVKKKIIGGIAMELDEHWFN